LTEEFEMKATRPGFLLYDENDELAGVTCLMLDDSFVTQSKGRFVLLHSRKKDQIAYKMLLESVIPYAEKRNSKTNFLFIPSTDFVEKEILMGIGFEESRKAYFLEKRDVTLREIKKPDINIQMQVFKPAEDMDKWCEIINVAYKDIPGHIPYTTHMVQEDIETDSTFPGCAQICYEGDKPIGLFYCSLEAEDELWISQLAILPEYCGKGLGRFFLQICLNLAADFNAGCSFTINSENTAGLNLFLSEGFTIRDEYTAYCYYLGVAK